MSTAKEEIGSENERDADDESESKTQQISSDAISRATVRRRARDRENQKKYRVIRKERQVSMENVQELLKEKNFRASIYLALIAQGSLLRPERFNLLRGKILEIYADLFEYGVDLGEPSLFKKQKQFLSFSFSDSFRLSVSDTVKGYKPFLDQCVLYKQLHDRLKLDKISVECSDSQGEIFTLIQRANLVISRRTVMVLYPHMLDNVEFMAKAVGKELVYDFKFIVTFGSDNRIQGIVSEHPYALAWYRLLKDATMTAQLLQLQNINNNAYITAYADPVRSSAN